MRRRQFLQYTGGGLAAAAVIGTVGCGDDDDGEETPAGSTTPGGGTTPGASPTTGAIDLADSQVLRTRFYFQLLGMDPATIFGIEQENTIIAIYNGLTKYNTKTELESDLAENWEQPDDQTYVFHLANATWQKDYGPVTAEDVAFSYNRIIEGGGSYAGEYGLVQSVTALDEKTVEIKLTSPDAAFPHQVANYHQGSIINAKALQDLGDDHWFNPVGTGPFILSDVRPGESHLLTRFDGYFKGPATISEIQMRTIADANTAAVAMKNNEIDVFQAIRSEAALDTMMGDPNIGFSASSQSTVGMTAFNSTLPYLDNPMVRKAFAHAIDFPNNIAATAPRISEPHFNMIPKWMPEYTADVPTYEYDPQKAKELLSAAGVPEGFAVKSLQQSQPSEVLLLMQANLAEVGITLEFEIVDRAQFNARRVSGDFETSSRGNPAGNINFLLISYLDPKNFPPVGFNGARYDNPEVTEAIYAARSELDEAARLEKYHQIQRQVAEDYPYLVTGASNEWWAFRSNVKNLVVNNLPQGNWYDLAIAKS